MTLSNKKLSEAVSAVKFTLMLHCFTKTQTKQVLQEVNAQLLEGKTQDLHMKYRVSKLQQDGEVMDFLINLPLEELTQAKCAIQTVGVTKKNEEGTSWQAIETNQPYLHSLSLICW